MGLFVLLVSLLLVLPTAAWSGFVVHDLWRWFAVPLGVPAIGVWEAAGLCLLIRLLAWSGTGTHNEDQSTAEQLGQSIVLGALAPLFALGFGAIVHSFAG